MKHEQVVPDYIVMLESSITVLALVGCGWLLFKLVQSQISVWSEKHYVAFSLPHRLVSACIWFPQYMKNLQYEADKANEHIEEKLLPKEMIDRTDEQDDDDEGECSKQAETTSDHDKEEDKEEAPVRERKPKKKVVIKEPSTDDDDEDSDEPAENEDKSEEKPEAPESTIDESKKDK